MSEREDGLFLSDILSSIEKIEKFTLELSYEDFLKNDMALDAVLRNFEIIGEASTHVSEETRLKYPGIPWGKMKSMRNILIHEYFGVDFEIIWKTLKGSLPELKKEIIKTL